MRARLPFIISVQAMHACDRRVRLFCVLHLNMNDIVWLTMVSLVRVPHSVCFVVTVGLMSKLVAI